MKKHNGEIDLFRLFFALIICFGHWHSVGIGERIGVFYIGVDFFFILSGYFMVITASKVMDDGLSYREIGDKTWQFIWKKIKSFYRYYIMAVFLRFIVKHFFVEHYGIKDAIVCILRSVPVFSLTRLPLDMQGSPMYLGASWYLFAMLFALFVLYPVLLKFGNTALKVVFPLIFLLIFGFISGEGISVSSWNSWLGFGYLGLLRALADVSLGAVLFPLSKSLFVLFEKTNSCHIIGVLLAVLKYSLWFVIFVALLKEFGLREIDLILLIAIAVLLSFSVPKFCISESLFTKTASKLSLGIYIFHCVFRDNIKEALSIEQPDMKFVIEFFAISVIGSILLTYLTDVVLNSIKKLSDRVFSKNKLKG